jgi:hypothetical protein
MKNIFFCLLIVSVFFIESCTIKSSKEIPFKKTEHYAVKNIDLKGKKLFMGSPTKMIFLDSSIIILNYKHNNYITMLDLKKDTIIEFGLKGKGPGELIAPMSIAKNCMHKNCFEVYDFANKSIFIYDIDSCRINMAKVKPLKKVRSNFPSLRSYTMNDSTMLNIGLFKDKYAFLISSIHNNDSIAQFGNYNYNPDDNNPPMNKCLAYQGDYSLMNSNFVWACNDAQIIEIYSFSEKYNVSLKKSIVYSYVNYKNGNQNGGYSSPKKSQNKMTYCDISTSSDKIYLLYSGKSLDNAKTPSNMIQCSEIHVLDWNGNFLEKMILNMEVVNICITDDGKNLFAIANVPEPQIVYIQL